MKVGMGGKRERARTRGKERNRGLFLFADGFVCCLRILVYLIKRKEGCVFFVRNTLCTCVVFKDLPKRMKLGVGGWGGWGGWGGFG